MKGQRLLCEIEGSCQQSQGPAWQTAATRSRHLSILREWARVLVSGLPTRGPANRESLTPSERNIRHSQLPGDSCKGELLPAQVRADTEITMV